MVSRTCCCRQLAVRAAIHAAAIAVAAIRAGPITWCHQGSPPTRCTSTATQLIVAERYDTTARREVAVIQVRLSSHLMISLGVASPAAIFSTIGTSVSASSPRRGGRWLQGIPTRRGTRLACCRPAAGGCGPDARPGPPRSLREWDMRLDRRSPPEARRRPSPQGRSWASGRSAREWCPSSSAAISQ